jgi:SAM-dependent methyltransferase
MPNTCSLKGIDLPGKIPMSTSKGTCIVCDAPSERAFKWSFRDIQREYEGKFHRSFPAETNSVDYEMLRCMRCQLLYASPQIAGDSHFYAWITIMPNYYQAFRWEWGAIRDYLATTSQPKKLLEIGCGTGNFLKFITSSANVEATGIDTHLPSVQAACEGGVYAKCMDLDRFLAEFPESRFDVVCAFHCLEHVESPKALMVSAAKALAPGGVVIMSVPYSPTSQDVIRMDPMNLPPHHLTQWNQNSLIQLGAAGGLIVDIRTDDGIFQSSLARTIYWYFLSNFKDGKSSSFLGNIIRIAVNPLLFLKCVRFVLTREKVAGKPAGNTVLALFRSR